MFSLGFMGEELLNRDGFRPDRCNVPLLSSNSISGETFYYVGSWELFLRPVSCCVSPVLGEELQRTLALSLSVFLFLSFYIVKLTGYLVSSVLGHCTKS
jgi:hypothetical protein